MTRRHATFTVTLRPNAMQETTLGQHCGASRFAYNWGVAQLKERWAAWQTGRAGEAAHLLRTGFDLINLFNRWKRSPEAGMVDGQPGLPWRHEVSAQVFEEALMDLGRGVKGYLDSKRGQKRGGSVGFPRFKKKGRCRESFRVRNKHRGSTAAIRLGDEGPRSLTLPKLGCLPVRHDTRRLRRLLARGRILFATVVRHRGRWLARLNCEVPQRIPPHSPPITEPVGLDRGLLTFAVLADAQGGHHQTIASPRPLRRFLRALRRASRQLSRKKPGSRSRRRAAYGLGRLHGRLKDIRSDFLHRTSTELIKNHDCLVLEQLQTSSLMKNRCLARHIADSGWAQFAKNLAYKAQWWGRTILWAGRFYPSSKRCSACGSVVSVLPLSQRQFACPSCSYQADRDHNAARNLAQWPLIVACKQRETKNACGGRSAGSLTRGSPGETAPREAGRGSLLIPYA
jgi:putative transposase